MWVHSAPEERLGAEIGMLVVETIAKIRRAYFVQKKAIKEICRELKVSRKTVRRVVRSGATEFVYERKVQPQPKIGPWREELDRLLDDQRVLQRNIRLRNPYVDPLHLLQIDLLQRWRDGGSQDDHLLEALKGTVKGIALGIQNTG